MRIYDLMTNRLVQPLGFTLDPVRLSYKVDEGTATHQEAARIRVATDEGMTALLHDSGKSTQIDSLCYLPGIDLLPRTRYWWDVTVWANDGEVATSAPAWFETGKRDEPWQAAWITAPIEGNINLYKAFAAKERPVSARAYATGVGLYELSINGRAASDEMFAPFYNDYDSWIQVQTYDLDDIVQAGENQISVMLGDGWYKGRFGFKSKSEMYGNTQALLLEIHLTYADGSTQVIATDETWQAGESRVRFANIYDGEVYDATFDDSGRVPAQRFAGLDKAHLMDRLSPPLRVTQRLAPREIITTPAGETVLDLGQEITGYLEFRTHVAKGTTLKLSYFEILQGGNYYRDNLRTALQEQTYIADGEDTVVQPHFTFFGFRYVKLEGFDNPSLDDFTGCVVHSDIPQTVWFASSNEKVNRLWQNVLWGQRGNFLDVPTDCPQRDERMGWTGDAQAFVGTACYQMESAAFFDKYLYDMRQEQAKLDGAVPHVVPMVTDGFASCAWADAATIIPWTNYVFYGDKVALETAYPGMRDWVEWIIRSDEANGGRRLWDTGFHFADWLALDTKDGTPMGGTDPYFIASAYYFYSTSLLLKAARALGYADDIARYERLQQEIFEAIQREYFTPTGRLAQTTQTGYVCALFMGFATEVQRPVLAKLLAREFEQSNGQLRTGFVGTAYLCRALADAGLASLAYDLLLREEYPSWLYEVNMGATTIWERWNSVLPDGSISDTGMNSLNHYAYGAVMEWVYRDVAGINPVEGAPGFRRAMLRPRPDGRLPEIKAAYESAVGRYESEWTLKDGRFTWHVRVPFGATAQAILPGASLAALQAVYPDYTFTQADEGIATDLAAGQYTFAYDMA